MRDSSCQVLQLSHQSVHLIRPPKVFNFDEKRFRAALSRWGGEGGNSTCTSHIWLCNLLAACPCMTCRLGFTQQQLYGSSSCTLGRSCSSGHDALKLPPHRTQDCCVSAHLDAPGFDTALQQLCFRSKAAQQVPVLIHSSHCVQVVMQQPAQGHLQGRRSGKVKQGRQSKAGQGKAEQGWPSKAAQGEVCVVNKSFMWL